MLLSYYLEIISISASLLKSSFICFNKLAIIINVQSYVISPTMMEIPLFGSRFLPRPGSKGSEHEASDEITIISARIIADNLNNFFIKSFRSHFENFGAI